jgi:hypothetical protein
MNHLNNQENKLLKGNKDNDGKREEPANNSLGDDIKTTSVIF